MVKRITRRRLMADENWELSISLQPFKENYRHRLINAHAVISESNPDVFVIHYDLYNPHISPLNFVLHLLVDVLGIGKL